jgi:very-short-patch-repair endonuclease
MDFAHIEGKIDIELDGLGHKASSEEDAVRDKILRLYGWKIIRIKH